MRDVVVIGAGITGLSAGFWLQREKRDVLVCDASDTIGGVIGKHNDPEFPFETGPNSLLDNRELTRELLEELNLSESIVEAADVAQDRFVFVGNALRKAAPSPSKLFKILGFMGLLRLAMEPLIPRRSLSKDEESVAQFFDRRLGVKARRRLVDAFIGGIYAGDSRELSMRSCFPRVVAAVAEHGSLYKALRRIKKGARTRTFSFRGGMATWVQTLAQSIGTKNILLNAEISHIETINGGFRLHFSTPSTREPIETKQVLLSAPAPVSAELLKGHVSDRAIAALQAIPYGPIATVGIAWEAKPGSLEAMPLSFGFLAPRGQGLRILGGIFSSAIFPSFFPKNIRAMTVFLGGVGQPKALQLSDEEMTAWLREDLRKVLGQDVPFSLKSVTRWFRGIPQLTVGHSERLECIEAEMRHTPGIHLAGNYIKGVSLHDSIASAYHAFQNILEDE